ncbi:tetratricopeptide repeat protein [Nitrosomonas sp. PY1]|uniref:FxSxx-COOH system tetratricopeptide repeat protein n=1 Tax=Nitrosomonas sp. PY1 TaxID=1803906 RepID=UPI001FC7EEE4|nr:FxSxx-COOH system tetratricopeptide repeat protein [Nitrosomonas sp. PY1]GKS70065.1 tetratricopeptide repeat protein [Nitrosomonas sp. PY1]
MPQVSIFISTVSAEFHSYRDALRHDLDRPNVTVKVQEDFIATGTETLAMLDEYISRCNAVIHLVGDMTGAMAQAPSLTFIRERYPDLAERFPSLQSFLAPDAQALSYTQWEAWLALYHRKMLIIAAPEAGAIRDEQYALIEAQRNHQQQHLERLATVERYPGIRFANADQLSIAALRSKLQEILASVAPLKKFSNLLLLSIGELFKGRAALLDKLNRSLGSVPDSADTMVVARVLSGLGGIGKTRIAIEYAWCHAKEYAAQLFVSANSVEALHRNLAGLCKTLELEERFETDEGRQHDAALQWLQQHPGWLLIFDNVDTEEVAIAVENLLPKLSGGHLLVTSRLTNWSGSLEVLSVDTLSIDAATEFLLDRTDTKRRKQPDDHVQASALAETLDGLALALEQAGAYIMHNSLSFSGYLQQWSSQREIVLTWHQARQMQYPTSVAVTWLTSFDQLSESARELLQHVAWLSPAPIPESLLEVPIPDGRNEANPLTALAELASYSLATRATDNPSFSVHRLVQEVTRRQLEDSTHICLTEALRWINAAFIGFPQDVRNWPVLDPLQPHVQAVITYADQAGIATPVSRLMNDLGLMYLTKSLYKEAEPLIRRALAIDEASLGADHPNVTRDLHNLAVLFKDTDRLTEAESLMRRALVINEVSFGKNHLNVSVILSGLSLVLQKTYHLDEAELLMRRALAIIEANFEKDHPIIADALSNLAQLLTQINRPTEAESLMRRALAIDEASFGENHPNVARDLHNLALSLQATNRPTEAESLMRRALAIDVTILGKDHPRVVHGYKNLASLLQYTNRLTEAELLIQQALAIDEASFGKDHSKITLHLIHLAILFKDANRLAEAESLMRLVLSRNEASFGEDHPNTAICLNNLAIIFKDTNRLTEAEPLVRRALAIFIKRLGVNTPIRILP